MVDDTKPGRGTEVSPKPAFVKSPGPSVQEVLERETRPVPDTLTDTSAVFLGDNDLDVSRYTSQEFHDLEMERMWGRVWQVACRADDIPNPGDHELYEIGLKQVIIVRTEDGSIKAFPNACLHRGTALRTCGGNVERFRCPFHGFTWSLSGELAAVPHSWDFPHVNSENFKLPEIRSGEWGGFVFICFSEHTEPLEDYLEDLPRHFERWPLEDRHKAVHVAKIIKCNWKVAQEAFLEAYHIPTTHPQSVGYSGDVQAQYDVWPDRKHMNRVIAWNGARNYDRNDREGQDKLADEIIKDMPAIGKPGDVRTKDGETAREALAERFREVLKESAGIDLEAATDAEMLDTIQYQLFPNFVPWSGIGAPIVYRFLPYKNHPDRCVMEVMYLFIRSKTAPPKKNVPVHWLSEDESFTAAKELGGLAEVFDQDLANLERIQVGLQSTSKPGVTLANYQEVRIRHYHQIIDHYLKSPADQRVEENTTKPRYTLGIPA